MLTKLLLLFLFILLRWYSAGATRSEIGHTDIRLQFVPRRQPIWQQYLGCHQLRQQLPWLLYLRQVRVLLRWQPVQPWHDAIVDQGRLQPTTFCSSHRYHGNCRCSRGSHDDILSHPYVKRQTRQKRNFVILTCGTSTQAWWLTFIIA